MKDRSNFINDHYKQHNFTSIGGVDMYAGNSNSYGGVSQNHNIQGARGGQNINH